MEKVCGGFTEGRAQHALITEQEIRQFTTSKRLLSQKVVFFFQITLEETFEKAAQ
jgi:hypothetical protein